METTELKLENDQDLNQLRETLRQYASDCGFVDYETTKLVTSASEISRNILDYTGGGTVHIEPHEREDGYELLLIFEDVGPGIKDVDRAMEDGYQGENSTGLGVGLPGAKRLADKFSIESDVEQGTTVELVVRRDSTTA